MSEPLAYILDALSFKRLRDVMNRLYDDKPLPPDQRRDLANTMFALLDSATAIHGDKE